MGSAAFGARVDNSEEPSGTMPVTLIADSAGLSALAITLPPGPLGSISPLAEFNLCDMSHGRKGDTHEKTPSHAHDRCIHSGCGTAGASAQEDTDNPVIRNKRNRTRPMRLYPRPPAHPATG
jgi:hypothetical protein